MKRARFGFWTGAFGLALAIFLFVLPTGTTQAAERKGKITYGILGGVGIPTGALNDQAKLGWRARAQAGYFLFSNLELGLEGAYGQNKADSLPASYTDYKTQIIEFGAYAKHLFSLPGDKLSPYVKLGVGLNSNKIKTKSSGGSNTSESETFLGGNLGVGLLYDLTPTLALALEGDFHNYAKGSESSGVMPLSGGALKFRPVNYGSVQAGVVLSFGRKSN